MADTIPEPVFPPIPATDPVVIPPIPEVKYDQWFAGPIVIRNNPDATYDLEVVWYLGNATELSTKQTNNIVRNITSVESLAQQLGQDFLDANPDIVAIMPQFLAVLAKIALKQGVL